MNDSKPLAVLHSADDVIDAVGGTSAAARLARASIASVSNWRNAGRLPPRTFLIFRRALAVIGAAAPAALWGIDDPATLKQKTGTN